MDTICAAEEPKKRGKNMGVGFFIHREIARNVEEFLRINERVAAVVIKLNRGYTLKIVQAYAPTAGYKESAERLQKMLEELQSESMAVGLKMNMNNYKVMMNKHAESALFRICNKTLDQVEEYNYLGQMASADPNHEREIPRRIGMGWEGVGKHSHTMKSKPPVSLKRKCTTNAFCR